jgi:GDP-4-dehydro-6-deoxy-D-mannose reductase
MPLVTGRPHPAPRGRGTVLVTGGAGFVGGHLLEHLAGRASLAAWARHAPQPALARLARWRAVDLLDRAQVEAAVRDLQPAVVYHCAARPSAAGSWRDSGALLATNVLGTHHLLEALRRLERPCRVLIPGSALVYAASADPIGEDHALAPQGPYAFSKLAQEQLGMRAASGDGLDVLLTRSFNHTGPRQSPAFVAPTLARQIARIEAGLQPPVLMVGNLDAVRDLTDVRDVVRAYRLLLERGLPGRPYNVASGTGRPIRALLDALLARSRTVIRVETDPARTRTHDVTRLVGDSSRLRADTGWEPAIPFDRTIDDLLEYWRRQTALEGA